MGQGGRGEEEGRAGRGKAQQAGQYVRTYCCVQCTVYKLCNVMYILYT